MKVLITCGPTWVAIDQVRVMSNISSGQMGHLIAKAFVEAKVSVTLLQGPVTDSTPLKGVRIIKYNYFDEMEKLLKVECSKNYDIIIHAAAVSDFMVENSIKGKIASQKKFNLKLVGTKKLINLIKQWAPKSFLVGFKLEPKLLITALSELTQKLFVESQCELVVANSTVPTYQGYIINADGDVLVKSKNKKDIAQALVRILL